MCKHQECFNFKPGAKVSGASLSLFPRSIPRNHLKERTSGCWLPNQLHQSEGGSEENAREKKATDLKGSTYHFLSSPVNSGPPDGLRAGPCGLHIFCDNTACLPVCPLGWMGETEALNFQRWQAWNQGYQRSPHLTSWCYKWGRELYLLFQVHNAVLILIHHAVQFRHCFSKFSYSFPNWGSALPGCFNVIVSSSLKLYFKFMREAVGFHLHKRKKERRWPAKSCSIKIVHNSRWLSFHLLILFPQQTSVEAMNVLSQYF